MPFALARNSGPRKKLSLWLSKRSQTDRIGHGGTRSDQHCPVPAPLLSQRWRLRKALHSAYVQTRVARKVRMAPAASSRAGGQSIVAGIAASICVDGAGRDPSRSRNRSANAGRMPSTPPMPKGRGHTRQDTAQPISHMPYEICSG
jgi:hypothetical protein